MTDPTLEERLAKLQARGRASRPAPTHRRPGEEADGSPGRVKPGSGGKRLLAESGDVASDPTEPLAVVRPLTAPTSERWSKVGWRPNWSGARVAAAGASVVSFASMVVAMGPLLATTEASELTTTGAPPDTDATGSVVPTAPIVDIGTAVEARPVPQPGADGLPPNTAPGAEGGAAEETRTAALPPVSVTTETASPTAEVEAPETAAMPTTAPHQTAAPITAPPETDPTPTTTPPQTTALVTAPPSTSPPTTAPPATAAPAPPRSEGSG